MAAGQLNILIEQGATFSRVLTVYSTGSTPLNLTGKTLRGQLRKNLSDADPAATFTFTAADQSTSPGVATWLLAATATALLPAQTLRYDVELVDGTTVTRILEGEAFVSGEVTR
jgi:hypothetical protein